MIATTLNAIREHSPCTCGWEKLLKHLGKTKADDEPLPLLRVLDSNGIEDTLWCFRALGPEHERWARLTVCDLVQPAMKYTTDPRPQKALDVSRAYSNGEATAGELKTAAEASWAAAEAAGFAWTAAWAAEGAARTAADGAEGAAWAAARAALAAAMDDARNEQERILRAALEKSE
jgi:hypothetical protein